MKKTVLFVAAATLIAGAAAAQDTPAGAGMMSCDAGRFEAVRTESGEIAYWTNATCPSSAGGREYGNDAPSEGEGGGVDIFEDLLAD